MAYTPSYVIAELERVVQSDVGRNISALGATASGGLATAGRTLVPRDGMSVALVTGAYIPFADPPAAETDGPAGAAMLGAGLRATGADVRLISDPVCSEAVSSVGDAAGLPTEVPGTLEEVEALRRRLRQEGLTHLISVERLGPARDGNVYNMRGDAVTRYTAPLHRLFADESWTTIGIGDGGNEIGMGALPRGLVAAHVDRGELIHCAVHCDHLIVSGVSNWGAAALLLSVGLLVPSWLHVLAPHASFDAYARLVAISVRDGGAVDGTTGTRTLSVDGLTLDQQSSVIAALETTVSRGVGLVGR